MISTLYEPFRHWSDGGSIYILSDLHFADSDCKLMDPHWITPEEQLEIINRLVFKNDTFICLGDVGEPKYVSMIKARKKILLLGNHDACVRQAKNTAKGGEKYSRCQRRIIFELRIIIWRHVLDMAPNAVLSAFTFGCPKIQRERKR